MSANLHDVRNALVSSITRRRRRLDINWELPPGSGTETALGCEADSAYIHTQCMYLPHVTVTREVLRIDWPIKDLVANEE